MEPQSFLSLLEAPTAAPINYDDFEFFEFSNQDDPLGVDEDQLTMGANFDAGMDPEQNSQFIPAGIEQMMDMAATQVAVSRQEILGGTDSSDEDEEPLARKVIRPAQNQAGFAVFDEMEMYGIGMPKKDKKKGGRKEEDSEEIDELMGQVSHLYASKDHLQAFKILHEVIKLDHKHAPAWKLLAVLHDELGDPAKALQANFIAAHLDVKDAGLWKRLAEISLNNGNITDSIYCFTKAIQADPSDSSSQFQRSMIYADQGHYYKAISGFNAVLELTPYAMDSIQELARIYIQLRESHKAIGLFESAMEADVKEPLSLYVDEDDFDELPPANDGNDPPKRKWRMGYEELLNLLELYIDVGEFEKASDAVETVVGRLEANILEGKIYRILLSSYENVPIEIRVKFGICRLWLEDHENAKSHFDALLQLEVDDYADLFAEVIDAYMKKRMFALAVALLEHVVTSEKLNNASIWSKMADCFQHLGRLEDAVELYKSAIEVEPREYDWQFQLAEIYEALGDPDRAAAIVEKVNELTKEDVLETVRKPRNQRHRKKRESARVQQQFEAPSYGYDGEEYDDDEDAYEPEAEAGGGVQGFLKPKNAERVIREDRAVFLAAERERIAENKEWYSKMLGLEVKLEETVKRADFVRFARKLVVRFQKERHFYPADRAKLYVPRGYRGSEDRTQMYQGLYFSQWFEVFVKCAMALTMDKKDEDAYVTLKSAFDANIFYHNEMLQLQLQLYMIAAATICGNYGRVGDLARQFCYNAPLMNDMYRMYCAVLNGGPDAVLAFASDICAKQFIRQLKTFEVHLAKHPNSEIQKNPILLVLYGHIIFSARSYASALSLAYLHWAMQRRIDNRHERILQAFTFLYQYEEIVGSTPEALYNIGRAFHQLGLNHLAVEYYERVLKTADDGTGLWPVKEAAYNLSLILHSNGSSLYAQAILEKHVSF
ncbi:transcription factor TFIIIC subunit tfc4 [Podochytrium sp. JEL0797]|nr:transcription factor TFIIIC subunit tfc4 [Podochytrium sp. JEL0797]